MPKRPMKPTPPTDAYLPNIWHLFNLRESPFFQDTLEASTDARYPIALFVGRTAEARRMLKEIGGKPSTRLAIKGPPGVGKTTLVQYLKSEVLRDAILSRPEPVAVSHSDTTDTFLLRLLSYVYETIVSHPLHASVQDVEPVQSARQLIRAFRLRSGGLSLTGPGGIGVGVSRETDVVTPEGVTAVEAPRLLRELARVIVDRLDAKGILVHVNNLENLSEADQTRSAGIMRDLRDQVLMNEHYHFVIVGTADAIQTVVTSHKQVRDVFGLPVPIGPLAYEQLRMLLARRYEHLVLDSAERPRDPVDSAALARLYGLFAGDLRGTLRALDEAAHALVGYGAEAASPMTWEDMLPVLRERYEREMTDQLTDAQAGHLRKLAGSLEATVTQKTLMGIWSVSQATVSEIAGELVARGYLEAEPDPPRGPGRPQIRYRLAGAARLIFP